MLDSLKEIRAGERFAFGANWQSFVQLVDDERIAAATRSLTTGLGVTDLSGQSFVDIGCGSGLFSLAAARLGARVHSFDFDPQSVAATTQLRASHGAGMDWTVGTGSILDPGYVADLGRFDVVYSWGVLHHTGRMWPAIAAATDLVAPGGHLVISIYNDQGTASRVWGRVKRRYNRSGPVGRSLLIGMSTLYINRRRPLARLARLLGPAWIGPVTAEPAPRPRGMSARHDMVDWVGGYPFEVARPEEVFRFVRDRGFDLRELTTCGGGLGCNEYVFRRAG